MELQGWVYLSVGILISVTSGVVYKLVPKPTGEPNMAMALFFFIGMIFMIIGVVKIFFRKAEMDSDIKLSQQAVSKPQTQARKTEPSEAHMNRVEAQINKIYSEEKKSDHTNQYSKAHPYQGLANPQTPAYETALHQQTAHQAMQHPYHQTATQHTSHQYHQPAQQHQEIHQHYTIVSCPGCHTQNYAHSNYCHNCGKRLR